LWPHFPPCPYTTLFRSPALADALGSWMQTRTDWRPNVLKFSMNLLDDLRPRAMTRDIDWGVPVPLPDWEGNPNKRLYVWFDAVIDRKSTRLNSSHVKIS